MKVTPWEAEGEIDYKRLIKEFGTQVIDERLKERIKKACGELHFMLRREFFFSHRDLDKALQERERGESVFLYTGRGPSRGMHIGHLAPLIFTKWLQEKLGLKLFIEITDDEKFLVKRERNWREVQEAADENILDIVAIGFDPNKTFIFKDSEYIKNVYPLLLKTARKITHSTVKAVFGFTDSTNIGLSFFPAYQIIPTFFEKGRAIIPCAIDQDPYWRVQRDIAEGLGYKKAAAIHSKFIPPLQGPKGKMSSSRAESAIYLDDEPAAVRKKIMKYAFSGGRATIEEHRKLGGVPEIDVSFQWLKILFEPDDRKLAEVEEEYRSGRMLTGELKEILVEKINKFLEEHRRKRDERKKEMMMYKGALAREMWERVYE